MQNIQLHFSYPWLLLLLIPAVFVTLFSYFKLNKRYRYTRNRIASIVLHLCVMFFAIFTLSGFVVRYQVPNETNEIVLVVDKSASEGEMQETIDDFVYSLIQECRYDDFNLAIVTFGFDYQHVVPMTRKLEDAYDKYLAAASPDVTATNLEDTLDYAQTLFTNPKSGKIVLVTDGKETDKNVNNVIGEIVSQGIVLDVAFVPSDYTGNDAQIIGITLPDYYIGEGIECTISVTIESTGEQAMYVALYDNGVIDQETGIQSLSMAAGVQTVNFKHVFTEGGLHEIRFVISPQKEDIIEQNNVYCTYYYLQTFDKILIIERTPQTSNVLSEMLNSDPQKQYNIQTVCVTDANFPNDIMLLRKYDQVILNNIANNDMPDGFEDVLESYVREYGGGLFTVGGNNEEGEANAYNREDMYGTTYQDMLPVEAVDYTPPIAVMVILDRSGSMLDMDDHGNSYFDGAKAGAISCLDALSDRDYLGVMTLDESPEVILPLTPRTQEQLIRETISSLEDANADHNTFFTNAINSAGTALNLYRDKVAKRHIIIISDCGVSATDTNYKSKIAELHDLGITVSIVGINQTANADMEEAVQLGGGRFYPVNSVGNLVEAMSQDLYAPYIQESNEGDFYPTIYNLNSPLIRDLARGEGENRNRLTVMLNGFYGVKIKPDADLILTGNYNVPIYAQWKYGKGTVGSFMCDLQGNWSKNFVVSDDGRKFIKNVVDNLMPTEDISPKSINILLQEGNYFNSMSLLTTLKNGEKLVGEIIKTTETGDVTVSLNTVTDLSKADTLPDCYVTLPLSVDNNYSRCDFVVKELGVYKIVIRKVDANGQLVNDEECIIYKTFSYSKEYDSTWDESEEIVRNNMETLATEGNGTLIEDLEDPRLIFAEFVKVINCEYDPRFLFMILSIVFFLADIAVRKFKFKWLHEIIQDRKKNQRFK